VIRVKTTGGPAAGSPTNDNLAVANDNQKRAEYMRGYMKRRRRGAKTLRQLLRDGLACVERRGPMGDPEAQAFIDAVRGLLEEGERGEA
jgi:hypothetical protein